jgi:calcium-dependent protein kinase
MIDRIMRCDYTFEKDYWNPVSDEAKDFISHLLVLDPKVRYKAEQAQKHKWMHKEFKLEDRAPNASISERVAGNLIFYKDTAALKKIALNVIAHRSSTNEIFELRKAFDQFDTANNGIISFDEFKEALRDKCSYTDENIKEMFDSIDVNQVRMNWTFLVDSVYGRCLKVTSDFRSIDSYSISGFVPFCFAIPPSPRTDI